MEALRHPRLSGEAKEHLIWSPLPPPAWGGRLPKAVGWGVKALNRTDRELAMRIFAYGVMTAALLSAHSLALAEDVPAKAQEVWRTFSEGVAQKDVEKVASVSRFPIPSNDLGGGAIVSKKALAKKFNAIFTESYRECLAKGKLEPGDKPGDWGVNCNGVIFGFLAKNRDYRFAYIENINE
jgi:hypothetical protein